ncbi:MAG: excinuclease ABC subunit UvrA [Mycoplasmatales bacterium]
MKNNEIIIKGAKENNLKNIDLTIPKDKLVVITGPSGSGKSTLAFDTIYAEGKRRYVESLSSYARQFLGGSEKPLVDSIEGLSPAISIDQKSGSNNPRSTVGTITEIFDYLRLLYARIGKPYCPNHNLEIKSQSPKFITDKIIQEKVDEKAQIIARVVDREKGTHHKVLESLLKDGYTRVIINDENFNLLDEIENINLTKNKKHIIDVIVDRLIIKEENSARLLTAIENALELGHHRVFVKYDEHEEVYSSAFACPKCDFTIPELEPRLFSFNSPIGACATCIGLGELKQPALELIIPNTELSINEGAIAINGFSIDSYYFSQVEAVCQKLKIDMDKPFKLLSEEEVDILMNGYDKPVQLDYTSATISFHKTFTYEGISGNIKRRYVETSSERARKSLDSLMSDKTCPTCKGARLSKEVLAVKINDKNINEVTELSIVEGVKFFSNLKLTEAEAKIGEMVLEEIKTRYKFLENVGLGYLTLKRNATTLSGGEAQRIRLATQIGSKLTGVLYVLDEPSIGLHQRDNDKLIHTLKGMRDLGNTLLVVEHDEDTMRESDYIIDIGPGAGEFGGEIVAVGTPDEIIKNKNSLTGRYLAGIEKIEVPKQRRKQIKDNYIQIKGAKENNLKNINVKIPLNNMVCVTGVSGSGKSTLINQILYKNLYNQFNKDAKIKAGNCKEITGLEKIKKVINIDQKPIGRTPRSNPATYVGVFDDIRDLFAQTTEAKLRGYQKGRFSFNVRGGRCEECEGDGIKKIEMNFLPDVYVTCERCQGQRYAEETLEIKYKEKSIADILQMSIYEANEFFENLPKLHRKFKTLVEVGLGYLKVGTPATVLSGGEAQRIKLAKELQKVTKDNTMYILDEPTTGLHTNDIKKLIKVLQTLVDSGNSMVIIEHNLDLIKVSDYIIDIGPEGGDKGGKVIAQGIPDKIVNEAKSYTGKYLKPLLK